MPRKIRVQYPGAIYHVMSRGDRGEDVFLDDVDRQDFLKTLAEACQKTGWQLHAYCLMRNHFHLVVETPNANLVEGMRWLLSAYTIRLNHRHKLFGHVFSGRYKALLETDPEALRAVRRGWCLGSEEFKREMLERVDGKLGENHSGELRQQTARQKAERIIAEELDRLKWQESDWARRRKCDPEKLAVAARLRTETTLTIKAIAERLHLGTPMNARVRLHGWMRNQGAVAGTQSGKVRVPNQVNVTV